MWNQLTEDQIEVLAFYRVIKNMSVKAVPEKIWERAFERFEQALETGVVSTKTVAGTTLTTAEVRYHEHRRRSLDKNGAAQSQNIINTIQKGKIKVVQI